ncbi:hypothetical protein PIB30_024092 [Stylosanthes scabra]|uniref:Uncharacterized protein n=1 Tax=Stylosanthes scabra TaxID=79078 RepID=A0ABU6U9M3_9FABA|nr:hypothetical protein [Stylosanthes scabra]
MHYCINHYHTLEASLYNGWTKNHDYKRWFSEEGGYQQRERFFPRRGLHSRNPNPSFLLPHTQISKPNSFLFKPILKHLENYPRHSLPPTWSPNTTHPHPPNPNLRPTIKPMACKTDVPRHLSYGASPKLNSPTPPSRGPPPVSTTNEPAPVPPPSSPGRYKIPKALGYHETRTCVFTSGKWDTSMGVDYLVAVKSICESIAECAKLTPTHKALGLVNAQLHRIINHYILPQSSSYQRVTFLDILVLYALLNRIPISFGFQEVNSYLKGDGAAKKQATRGKQSAEPSAPPRHPSGRKSSTGKKIKKIVKAMKEMIGEITNLVELMIRLFRDRRSQEEDTYLSDEEDAEDVARDEEEDKGEED